jgi:hypothetical protein
MSFYTELGKEYSYEANNNNNNNNNNNKPRLAHYTG